MSNTGSKAVESAKSATKATEHPAGAAASTARRPSKATRRSAKDNQQTKNHTEEKTDVQETREEKCKTYQEEETDKLQLLPSERAETETGFTGKGSIKPPEDQNTTSTKPRMTNKKAETEDIEAKTPNGETNSPVDPGPTKAQTEQLEKMTKSTATKKTPAQRVKAGTASTDSHSNGPNPENATAKTAPRCAEDRTQKGARGKEENRVEAHVLHQTLHTLRIKMKDKRSTSQVINNFVDHLIRYLKETTHFKEVEDVLTTGSYYEKLKISNPDEFDVMVPVPVERVDIQPFGKDGALYKVALKRSNSPLKTFQSSSVLSASTMLQEFREEVKKFLKQFTDAPVWKLTKKKPGCPAVTLTAQVEDVPISLDLVLCLQVKSSWPQFTKDGLKIQQWLGTKVRKDLRMKPYYLVPKYEGRGNEEEDGISAKDVWRVSFSHVEKEIILNHGSEKTCCERGGESCCRKDCLKLLKHLLHLLKQHKGTSTKFCSYHAKTALLHACSSRSKDSQWRASDLSHCFELLLQDFECHLKEGQLANFFVPGQNLLSGTSPKLCNSLADQIREQRETGFPFFQQYLHSEPH